jgi:predicted DNA-binding transcriptional regulator AlpA
MTVIIPEKLLTIKDFAELEHVHVMTIRYRMARGQVPMPIKRGNRHLWREADVLEYIKRAEAV